MCRALFVTSLLSPLLTLVPLNAYADEYRFIASVQFEREKVQTVSVALQPGDKKSIETVGGHRLEFEAPVSTDPAPVTVVRLLEESANGAVLKHQAAQAASAKEDRVFSYSICGNKVTFVSPARSAPTVCKG